MADINHDVEFILNYWVDGNGNYIPGFFRNPIDPSSKVGLRNRTLSSIKVVGMAPTSPSLPTGDSMVSSPIPGPHTPFTIHPAVGSSPSPSIEYYLGTTPGGETDLWFTVFTVPNSPNHQLIANVAKGFDSPDEVCVMFSNITSDTFTIGLGADGSQLAIPRAASSGTATSVKVVRRPPETFTIILPAPPSGPGGLQPGGTKQAEIILI